MSKIFDALESCLQELDKGVEIETALRRFPDLADELRPILKTAVKARHMSAPGPSPETMRRGRARVMQFAAEARASKRAPAKRVIPAFSRLAISFALAAVFLLSGTGILSASASALPGENLYPVKRGWESVRLLLIFDKQARELLANEFENERLHEVNELLAEGRHETIQVAGVFIQMNGKSYVSGLPIFLPANVSIPENGAAVVLTGRTNAEGVVEVATIELLPDGSVVPAGFPIEMEPQSKDEIKPKPTPTITGSGSEAPAATPVYYEVHGTLQSISAKTLTINGMTVFLAGSYNGNLCVGMKVEVYGYYARDGRFIVTELETKGSCPGINDNNSGKNSNSNGDDDHNDDNGGGDNDDDDDDDDDDDKKKDDD